MKRVLHSTIALLLSVMLFAGVIAPNVNAAEELMTVEIPVSIEVTGSEPVDGAFVEFEFKAVTEGAPMPNDLEDEAMRLIHNLTASGDNSFTFTFEMPVIGVYEYTIQMVNGTYFHEEDSAVYHIEVYNLTNGFEDSVVIYTMQNGVREKVLPAYQIPLQDLTTSKRWNNFVPGKDASVEIALLLNDKAVEHVIVKELPAEDQENAFIISFDTVSVDAIKLSEKNDWQGTWAGLDAREEDYSVKEVKVPEGFHASYKISNGIYTVTNTRSLYQTGQLNWPIPVLAAAGIFFVAVGLVLNRRKEEENA